MQNFYHPNALLYWIICIDGKFLHGIHSSLWFVVDGEMGDAELGLNCGVECWPKLENSPKNRVPFLIIFCSIHVMKNKLNLEYFLALILKRDAKGSSRTIISNGKQWGVLSNDTAIQRTKTDTTEAWRTFNTHQIMSCCHCTSWIWLSENWIEMNTTSRALYSYTPRARTHANIEWIDVCVCAIMHACLFYRLAASPRIVVFVVRSLSKVPCSPLHSFLPILWTLNILVIVHGVQIWMMFTVKQSQNYVQNEMTCILVAIVYAIARRDEGGKFRIYHRHARKCNTSTQMYNVFHSFQEKQELYLRTTFEQSPRIRMPGFSAHRKILRLFVQLSLVETNHVTSQNENWLINFN